MGNEAWFNDLWWARREGDRICIGKSYERKVDLTEAVLVLSLTEGDGLALDPRWEQRRRSEIQHERQWRALLHKLTLPVALELKLLNPPPLCLYPEQTGMLKYLRKLARDGLYSPVLEEKERKLLTEALDANFPEGESATGASR